MCTHTWSIKLILMSVCWCSPQSQCQFVTPQSLILLFQHRITATRAVKNFKICHPLRWWWLPVQCSAARPWCWRRQNRQQIWWEWVTRAIKCEKLYTMEKYCLAVSVRVLASFCLTTEVPLRLEPSVKQILMKTDNNTIKAKIRMQIISKGVVYHEICNCHEFRRWTRLLSSLLFPYIMWSEIRLCCEAVLCVFVSQCVVSVCTIFPSAMTHHCFPDWSPSICMFCVVSGAGAGYGAQQTGEFNCTLWPKGIHILSHGAQGPFFVSFVTPVHHIAVHRGGCMSMTVISIFSIRMSCIIEILIFKRTL